MAIEEPAFDRIEQSEPFEVRQYRSMIVAEHSSMQSSIKHRTLAFGELLIIFLVTIARVVVAPRMKRSR